MKRPRGHKQQSRLRRKIPLRAVTVWLLALALLAGVLAQNIWTSRQNLLRNAEQRLISDLAVGSRYVFERIASLKSKLETLDHQLPNGDTLFAKRQAHSLLKNLAGDDRSLLSMFIIEPTGMAYATFRTPEVERVDLSDRSYFRAVVEGGGTGIYISEPHIGRLGHAEGRQFVAVSAPWHDDQGGVQGVLVGLLDFTSITELLTASVHDGSTRISVFTDDGRRVFGSAHHIVPSDQLASCTDAARGYEVQQIDIADRQHLFACQELGPLGLSGAITRPIDAALMPWRANSIEKALMGLILAAILLGAFILVRLSAGRSKVNAERAELLSTALDQASGAIAIADDRLNLVWVNESACRVTGYDRSELLGRPVSRLLIGTAPQSFFINVWRSIRRGAAWTGILKLRRRDGYFTSVHVGLSPLLDQMGQLTHFLAIQDQSAALEAQLRDFDTRIRTDDLTGLLNRPGLVAAYASAYARSQSPWIGVLDIERFRILNELLGRAAADGILREVANFLRNQPEVACAGRVAGDRFAIWGDTSNGGADAAEAAILRVHRQLEYHLERHTHRPVRITLGYLSGDELTGDADEDLSRAEAAVAAARSQRGTYVLRYSSDLVRKALDRERLTDDFAVALVEQQFHFMLQPQVSLADHRTIGAELLMRWTHPALGSIPPDVFIPLAEHSGVIVGLGRLAATQAASIAADWARQGFEDLRLSFNVSVVELENSDFANELLRVMQTHDVPPTRLVVEVTESSASMATDVVRHQLDQLIASGFGVEIDDFGTGYATLSQLRALPHTGLKIDREFTDSLDDRGSELIVQSVISVAREMDWSIVAEGIETGEQAAWLAENGCQYGQGYYFGKPMSSDAFFDRLTTEVGHSRAGPTTAHSAGQ